MKILFGRLDRDPNRGLYLDFKLELEDSDNDKKISLLNEDGVLIYEGTEYLSAGDTVYESVLVNKDFFNDHTTSFTIRTTNKDNYDRDLSNKITVNTYKINIDDVEVRPVRNNNGDIVLFKTYVRWKYDNYSTKSMMARILFYPIKDNGKDVSYDVLPSDYNDNSYIKSADIKINDRVMSMNPVTCIDMTPEMLFSDTSALNSTSIVLYRISLKDGKFNKFYPEQGAFRYKASNVNEEPIIKLENIEVKPTDNTFQLTFDSLLRDSNLDDIRYVITDNHGNTVYQQDYYSYTPRIDKIKFNYDIYNFNSLFLDLNAKISDNLNFSYSKTFKYQLFDVKNLRIRRDRLVWDVRNYSNNILKTTVEILDMYNNIVYTGDTIATRLEKDYITVTDDKVIKLITEMDADQFYRYYKFRIKVRCDDVNYTGYVEFENGTLVSTQHHNAPKITIYDSCYPNDYYDTKVAGKFMRHLERDDDNNKKLKIIFDLEPDDDSAIGDYCQYTVSDDSGNLIYMSKDKITLPQRIELYQDYDFTKRVYNKITISCTNEYNNKGESTIEIPSYYIVDPKVIPGSQKISFKADNYYEGDINIICEIHDLYYDKDLYSGMEGMPPKPKDGKKYDFETEIGESPIVREEPYKITVSEETTQHYIRLIPKMYYDNYGHVYKLDQLKPRFRVEASQTVQYENNDYSDDSSENKVITNVIKYEDKYVPVTGFIEPRQNTAPSIMINYSVNEIDADNIMTCAVNASIADGDGDRVTYSISDRYGTLESKELFDIGEDNVYNTLVKKQYNLSELKTSMIQWNFLAFDEEGLSYNVVHKIPLHYVSSLIFVDTTLQYKVKLYTKKSITTLLEILDDEGYLYAQGKEVSVSYYEETKTISEAISIKKFKPGNYRYRIKVTSEGENWQLFYPNLNGEIINITKEMIDADTTTTSVMATKAKEKILLDDLKEYQTILNQKLTIGTYTNNEKTILGRMYQTMNNLTGTDRTNAIIELLDVCSNHHDDLVVDLREYGEHLMSNTSNINGVNIKSMRGYSNYGMDMQHFLYNISGYPLEFIIKENSHLPYEKYHTRAYVNGKKILENKTNSQILNDGMTKFYVGTDQVPNNSCLEVETHKSLLDNVEKKIYSYNLDETDNPELLYEDPIRESDIEIFNSELKDGLSKQVTKISEGNYRIKIQKYAKGDNSAQIELPIYFNKRNNYYTAKIDCKVSSITGSAYLEIRNAAFRSDNWSNGIKDATKIVNLTGDWTRYSLTRQFENYYIDSNSTKFTTEPRIELVISLTNINDSIEFEFKNAQIEERDYDINTAGLVREDISFIVKSHTDISELRNKGKIISNIPSYYLDNDFIAYIERGNNRVNLFRSSVRRYSGDSIKVIIQDPVYIGDKIIIVTNTVEERQLINSSQMTGGTTTASKSAKPVYFIPLCFIDNSGNIIDISEDGMQNNLDVYIDGYLSVPNIEYIVLPENTKMSLPPILLFKDLIFPGTNIEIYLRQYDKASSTLYNKELSASSAGYYYFDAGASYQYPLVKGMFSAYCNNKKIPSSEIIVLNNRYLLFKKNVITTKNNLNFYIKVNYPDNPIVNTLLELYKLNPPANDSKTLESLINSVSDTDKLLSKSNKEEDNDTLQFLKYVYQLENSDDFKFLREMRKKLKDTNNVFKTYGLDASINTLFMDEDVPDVITNIKEVPKYFNHDINIFGSSSLFDDNNIEDNIQIANPSRVLRLDHYITLSGNEIDCSNNIAGDDYDIFLNEGIDIDMDYVVGDVEIERNNK